MARTIASELISDLYMAMDVVSREMVGLIPAVNSDMAADRVAKDEYITSFKTNALSAADFAAGYNPPDTGDTTTDAVRLQLTKERVIHIRSTGNEQKKLNSSVGYRNVLADEFEQAMRTLVNEIEADLAGQYIYASNAASPAGTTLFDAANYKDLAAVRKLLNVNGAPMMDRHLVLSNTASQAFVGNAQNVAIDATADSSILRQGVLTDRFGMALRESAQIQDHTKGTAASATTDNAGYAVGATTITLASAGTGTIVAGDIITFAGDSNEYVVVSGDADVSNGGTITIAAPGLKVAIAASATNITVVDQPNRSMAFSRNAIGLATRLIAMPEEGDEAVDSMIVQDPRSGLAFEVRKYLRYGLVHYTIGLAWGVKVFKPEHLVLLAD